MSLLVFNLIIVGKGEGYNDNFVRNLGGDNI